MKIGQVSVEFSNNQVSDSSGSLTSGQMRHVLLFALGGGVAGLLVGFAIGSKA